MLFENAYIPYGCYWSTPYCRWQGSFAHLHSMKFAAEIATLALNERQIPPDVFDGIVLGMTVPQKSSFYGVPWLAGMMGATGITGPTIGQACATGVRVLATAAGQIETGSHNAVLCITCDRTSNGPHIYYPNPLGPGGTGTKEDWVWDNFSKDPFARNAMIETAENVAKEAGIDRNAQDEVTVLRHNQYQDALKNESEFLKRFMILPVEVKDPSGRKVIATVTGDEGVFPTTADGLAKLRPVMKDGTVTFGTQTFPADGNSSVIVTTKALAKEWSRDPGIEIQLLSFGEGRAKKGYMPQANVPCTKQALSRAGVNMSDIKAIKTHNPFGVNDVYFAREMGLKFEDFNNYGSSIIWGHPQGPTGTRLIIELIEELVLKGGGYGLFSGCAAGDTAGGVVVKVVSS
jgi:acetyl-CoA acetyltransferase family protein